LSEQYKKLENLRITLRRHLIHTLEQGLIEIQADERSQNLFKAFKESIDSSADEDNSISPLTLVSNALSELLGEQSDSLNHRQLTDAFIQLLNALSDRSEGDHDGDGKLSTQEASDLWPTL